MGERPQRPGVGQQLDLGHLRAHRRPAGRRIGVAAGDPRPAGGQVAHHRADVLPGHLHRDLAPRLQQAGAGGRGELAQGQRAGGLEGGVGGVDRVRLAVDQGDVDVDDGAVAAHAAVGLRPDALLHAAVELGGHRAADDPLVEDDPAARRPGLALDDDDGVLPVPPGLLHVPRRDPRRAGEGLHQRYPDRDGGDRDAVPAAQPLEQHLGVRVADAPQQQLPGVGAALEAHGGVFGDQARQRRRQAVVVPARGGLDRHRQLGRGQLPRRHQERVVRGGQRVAGLGAGQPGDRADVAGRARRDQPQQRPQGRADGADPLVDVVVGVAALGQAVPGDVDGGVGPQRAGEDAHQRHPAHVGVGRRLHHLGDQRAVRIAGQRGRGRTVRAGRRREAVLARAREPGDDELQQGVDAHAGQWRGAQHRVEVAAGDGGLQVGDQVGLHQLVTGEVALHEHLVLALADDALDQLGPEPVGLDLPRPPARRVGVEQGHQVAHRAVGGAVDQVHGEHALPQQHLAQPHGLLDVGLRAVDLGEHHRARHADRRALLPERGGGGVHPVDGGDDEEGGIGRAQAGAQLAHEVRRPGGVQQGDAVAGVLDGRDAQRDRPPLPDLDVLGVQARRAVLHPAGARQRAGRDEQRLGQRRLAGTRVPDEGDVAHLLRRPGGRCGCGLLRHLPVSSWNRRRAARWPCRPGRTGPRARPAPSGPGRADRPRARRTRRPRPVRSDSPWWVEWTTIRSPTCASTASSWRCECGPGHSLPLGGERIKGAGSGARIVHACSGDGRRPPTPVSCAHHPRRLDLP